MPEFCSQYLIQVLKSGQFAIFGISDQRTVNSVSDFNFHHQLNWCQTSVFEFFGPPVLFVPHSTSQDYFDLVLKTVVSQRKTAVCNVPNHIQLSCSLRYEEETTIPVAPLHRIVSEAPVKVVLSDDWVSLAECMVTMAGFSIVFRLLHHSRPDRVHFNVSIAAQQVLVGIHQAGFIAPLEQCPGSTIAFIDIPDIAAT